MTHDPCRPTYHYSSGNWMNDVIPFHDGERLHVWFDHNPEAARWTKFSWGHASTADLVEWRTEPVSLRPQPGGPDACGTWTGCVTRAGDGRYVAAYTGVTTFDPFTQAQCLAWSTDLMTWEQQRSAVITTPPDGFGTCFRDPHLWQEPDGSWRMLVGSTAQPAGTAAVLVYGTRDLDDLGSWEYLGPFYVAGDGACGHHGECPELFRLGERDVLVMSCGQTRAVIGRVEGERFVADGPVTTVDPGQFYAAKSFDLGDRRVQFGWVRDTIEREDSRRRGWRGALSLPRDLRLADDGRILVTPSPEVDGLRGPLLHAGSVTLSLTPTPITGAADLAVELAVDLPAGVARAGVVVGCDPAGRGGVDVGVDRTAGTIGGHPVGPLPTDGPLSLRLFVDRSIVEAYAVGTAVTLRGYQLQAEPRMAVWGESGSADVRAWAIDADTRHVTG